MSEHQHTPGPWRMERAVYPPVYSVAVKAAGSEVPIAYAVSGGPGQPNLATAARNAALCAAAPDLLAACESVLDRLDYLRGLWGDEGITRGLADQVRAAVAKAKGEATDGA